MEALQLDPQTGVLSLVRKEIPVVSRPDQVVVQVAYSGFCGTDLHIIQREFPSSDQPFTQGHEFSGLVHQIGSNVTHVRVGDKVAVDPQNWCTTCEFCATGRYHLCELGGVSMATGIKFDGGWAEYALVLARQVYKLPNGISLKQGALCEPVSCVVRGIERASLKPPGFQSILIIGAGIIGNLWCAVLHHMGHREVTVVEPQRTRLELNRKLDTGYTCYTPEELRNAVDMDGHSWDLVIDCSGNGRAIEEAINAVRDGGTLCMFGVTPPSTKIRLSPYDVYKKELTICGSNINPFCFPRAVRLVAAMGERYLDYKKLGVSEFLLKDYAKGISILENGSSAKVMFAVNTTLDKAIKK
uniref:Putative sorbitol dehydrogenase n=1 Tax=Triatoma infestans TaxID=30076 RepID=A0A023FA93_TRIIF